MTSLRLTGLLFVLLLTFSSAHAQEAQLTQDNSAGPVLRAASVSDVPTDPNAAPPASNDNFIHRWLSMVGATQAEQPHWITPVVTVTPRLEQEYRFDLSRQVQPNGTTVVENFGGSKGLEIIPFSRAEILVNPPPYIVRSVNGVPDGFGDLSFLMKYRLLSANEEHGNYILTAFLGASVPTGSYTNGTMDATISPTLAAGKGWGNWDVTSTLGAVLPVANADKIGRQMVWNSVVQYRLLRKIWPELENNYTYFSEAANNGKKQNFVTPGIVFGRFPIRHRFAFTIGTGVQIATTKFHTYNHKYILTVRFPF